MERRDFIKTATAASLAAATAAGAQQAETSSPTSKETPVKRPEDPSMIYRELGTTGERVSAIGLGGFHLAKEPGMTAEEAIRVVRTASDHGITFFDNCWDYNDGLSEVRLGQALKDGYRQKAFVMTKLDARTAKDYDKQLEQSLGRLDTDVIDLVQFHEIIRFEDPDRIFADDGAIHAAMAARKAGKIRYIGFTGHKDPQIHLRMFEIAAEHNFHFDTVQMPINGMDAHFRSFAKNVIPVAQKAGTGVLAMKTFGDGYILRSGTIDPIEALHYSLSQPVSVVITGVDSPEILTQALTAAKTFQPMTAEQTAAFLARTREAAMTGRYEPFKTSSIFDSTATNPKWLGGSTGGKEVKPSSPQTEEKRVGQGRLPDHGEAAV